MSSRRKKFFRIADLDGQYKSSFRSVRGMRNASTHAWHGTCQLSIHLAGPTDALCKISTSELYDTGCRIEWSSKFEVVPSRRRASREFESRSMLCAA